LAEQALGALPVLVCFLRAAWFMENAAWDVAPARDLGVVPSFLQPLDKPVPMVATADIGRLAAALLQETWTGPIRPASLPSGSTMSGSETMSLPVYGLRTCSRTAWADFVEEVGK
jgi:uncharacterized protein YbjT (DUF2867 family)